MNRLIQSALAALLMSVACVATASEATGRVAYIVVRDSDGLIYVELDSSRTGKPACAANQNYFMIKDETSLSGRRTHATLLAAKLSGLRVTIWGTGACTRWGDGEDIAAVRIAD